MAKRKRRIFKIKNSSLFAFIIVFHLVLINGASCYYQTHHQQQNQNHHHQQQQQQTRQHQVYASQQDIELIEQQQLEDYKLSSQAIGANNQAVTGSYLPSYSQICSQLPIHVARQLKLCKLVQHSANADEAVTSGASKALAECRVQFKSERWNCTHAHGDHHLLTSELAQSVGNRESGFVHAIAAAGIVHSIAHACSVGTLSDCACDKTRISSSTGRKHDIPTPVLNEKWKWGGCTNNIRHGMLYAKHLVELLDAVHQQDSRQQQVESAFIGSRQLSKRSLSSKHREPNQVRSRSAHSPVEPSNEDQQQQQILSGSSAASMFCQRNHNISQATHIQLVKSLLAKNSLEKHQEFRLAMNMHNNKVGRMVSTASHTKFTSFW